MSEEVLAVRDLRIEFPELFRTVKAVRGADLSVHRGEIMGLVGESGCGKSMTAMACLGLVPPPGRVSGHISVDGFEVVGRPDRDLLPVRGGLAAMIFQNPGKALKSMSVNRRRMRGPGPGKPERDVTDRDPSQWSEPSAKPAFARTTLRCARTKA